MTAPRVVLRLLGPMRVEIDGRELALGGLKQRGILALLLTADGRAVSVPALLDALWADGGGDNAGATLQVHVSNLRKALAAGGEKAPRVELMAGGYRLTTSGAVIDLDEFRRLRRAAAALTASGAHAEAAQLYDEALAWWQGPALADVVAVRAVNDVAVALDEDRLVTLGHRVDADLACGRHAEVVGELRRLVAEHPLRERFWEQLVLALYRSGRQADALAAYSSVRRLLLDELGVDPGRDLRELETGILEQSETLAWSAPVAAPSVVVEETLRADDEGRPAAVLVAADGSRTPLGSGRTTIGRHPECSILVDDAKVSRHHAELVATPDGWAVSDLGSTNGTFVNGSACRSQLLADGDQLTIGTTTMTFVLSTPDA
jgi:DNA-binding SARP family transcriptional activator